MDLSIISINYKTKEITSDTLETIEKSNDKYKKEVIVVDADSQDGSVEHLKKKFPKYNIIDARVNGGFSFGNNLGAKKAKGKYVWLLNSDTLLEKNTIQLLMDQSVKNDSDIASCKLLNKDKTIQQQGGNLPTLCNLSAWMFFIDDIPLIKNLINPYQQRSINYYKKDQHPGWVGGTALLIKRKVYEELGGLDDGIFMYGEDTDFCYRAKKAGYVIDYFSTPKLIHLGQASGSSKGAVLGEFKGLKYFYKKHKPSWQMPILRLILKIGAALRVLLFGIILRDENRKSIYKEAFSLA
ncbi:glycosyltransferase family 2 protein [Patescibacteria group bacterium]